MAGKINPPVFSGAVPPARAGAGNRDDKAPAVLTCTIADSEGKVWGIVPLDGKAFSTGSVGYYGSGKVLNPANPTARYQVGFNLTLVGSKG